MRIKVNRENISMIQCFFGQQKEYQLFFNTWINCVNALIKYTQYLYADLIETVF